MAGESESDDKQHDPTPRRLEEARARGEVARSAEVTTAAGYAGLVLALIAAGGAMAVQIGGVAQSFLAMPDRLAPIWRDPATVARLLAAIGRALIPIFLLPALLVLVALIAQRAVIFTPDKLMPRLDRISPIEGAKRRFGRNGLFEFAKSFVKLVLVGALLTVFLAGRLPEILGTVALDPREAVAVLARQLLAFLALVAAISAVIGAVDLLWQHVEFLRRNRMSRQELIDDMKESEGDPQMKQQRRRRGQEIATNRMIADVARADVVIVNPTHYAVALKWSRAEKRAPICLAKGVDEVAMRIREAAAEAGVPVRRDPPTARMLHAEVEIGAEILPAHYRAVAAAIRFAETMQARARRSWR